MVSWNLVLSCFVVVMVAALFVAFNTKFKLQSDIRVEAEREHTKLKAGKTWFDEIAAWPVTVYLMGLALFSYVVAETIIVLWLVVFGHKEMGMTMEAASSLASIFWGSVIVGRFIAGYVLRIISQELYICIICVASGILLLMLSTMMLNITVAYILISLCGIGFAAAYSTIASTGTTQIPHATSRLTSAMLGAGAVGTVAAPLISSYIETAAGLEYVFVFCAVFMLIVALLVIIVQIVNKARGYDAQKI